jgi:type III restriction enzyme
MIMLPNGLLSFQERCVNYLLNTTASRNSKQTIVVKSPTGSGKTVMLIDYIDKYLDLVNPNTCFVWFSPGRGDLEEQSQEKMQRFLPSRNNVDVLEVLLQGFKAKETAFINWERVTKKGNLAITEGERRNLFEQIAKAHRDRIEFIVLIDEEHSNDTSKAKDVIDAFNAKNIIRVSATARKNYHSEWYEIPELEVINSGLITRAMYINENVDGERVYDLNSEYQVLIDLAEEKREAIGKAYLAHGKKIRPLVIVQFPPKSERLITVVEESLYDMGVTYENKLLAKWLSEEKINIEGIEKNNATPEYLLFKQATAMGWDCPRAKILVKLRERMNEDFEIQTIGRIRRMPEAVHYEDNILDFCYLYTFDEKYKDAVIKQGNAYEVKRLFLKEKGKTFQLKKQNRDLDFERVGERETLIKIYDYLKQKYELTNKPAENYRRIQNAGFTMGTILKRQMRQGKFVTTDDMLRETPADYLAVGFEVDTHAHGLDMQHAIDLCKVVIGLSYEKTRAILRHLFVSKLDSKNQILKLGNREFYAFMINNGTRLRDDFRELVTGVEFRFQDKIPTPKETSFKLPAEELYRTDPCDTDPIEYLSNVYHQYDSSMIVHGLRSRSERLFENYCDGNEKVDWVYKNGDKGQQYLSILYVDSLAKQHLFYPDYIIKLKDGRVFIIETKGGEVSQAGYTIDMNIDDMTMQKFRRFTEYSKEQNIQWAFVRDKNDRLYFDNTIFTNEMNNEHWQDLRNLF